MIKEIEKLNKQIDRLMTEKTKYDAQKEVWQSRLVESIKAYQKEYGVDLSGKDLAEIKKKVSSENNIVEAKTKKEFELSAQLVKLVNDGDIKGAWKLLGVDLDAANSTEVKEEVKETSSSLGVQGAIQAVEEIEDGDFFGESFDEEEEEEFPTIPVVEEKKEVVKPITEPATSKTSYNPFMFEDDDEEEEDEFVTQKTKTSPSAMVVEDEDDGDDFGGFGSILKGSKFEL